MRALLVVVALILAGCAQAPVDEPGEPVQSERPPADGKVAVVEEDLSNGTKAPAEEVKADPKNVTDVAPPPVPKLLTFDKILHLDGTCSDACPSLWIEVPKTEQDAYLDVRITWDGTVNPGMQVALDHGDFEMRRGYDVARLTSFGIEPGVYEVQVDGNGAFLGEIRLRSPDVPSTADGRRLPNLVTLQINEIGFRSCLPEEQIEEGAERCLRLGNAVGNIGDGPLEVHLDYVNGVLAAGGMGKFIQRIYTDGGHEDRDASGAEIHPTHGHFHYAGLAHFELWQHDPETGLRGDLVATGHKRGFCFLDWGDMNAPEAPSEGGQRAEQQCLIPNLMGGWSMGISRGYYDFYWAALADQYIDVAGVEDGTYELVSIADGADTLLETDETDNKASVIIEIEGNAVQELEHRALWDNPEGP